MKHHGHHRNSPGTKSSAGYKVTYRTKRTIKPKSEPVCEYCGASCARLYDSPNDNMLLCQHCDFVERKEVTN